ncbi:B-cell receptor CD22-like isoform X1 [Epinephelus fuscoguttatus]|uniref:B-cell receptor CD22-like isoform X1 n=1 Tax=Epinephelus fuscoguttatus TaxID=293821 RepID=UPI0020D161D4|nr:B-cell receptor CD22-like isoform X1 [Epinephelus fuscoguttatus]
MNMASFAVLALFTALCISAGNADFIKLQCKARNVGEIGQQSLLKCVVKSTQDPEYAKITVVTWMKVGDERPLLILNTWETRLQPGYMFDEPSWNGRNVDVSLLITNTAVEHEGIYMCMVMTDSGGDISQTSLIVTGLSVPSVSVSPSAEIVEGRSVTLTCSSDANPAANYTWYKEDEDSPKASGQIFTITDIRAEHSGNYYCEAQNTRGRHNSTLHLTVVADHSVMYIIRLTLVVLVLTLLLLLSLWTRKKKTLSFTTEAQKPVEIETHVLCMRTSQTLQHRQKTQRSRKTWCEVQSDAVEPEAGLT